MTEEKARDIWQLVIYNILVGFVSAYVLTARSLWPVIYVMAIATISFLLGTRKTKEMERDEAELKILRRRETARKTRELKNSEKSERPSES